MPGMRDSFKKYDENGNSYLIQKRMLLACLRDLYIECKQSLGIKVGLTKFMSLKPEHCVFASHHSAHNICICVYHENTNLILKGLETIFKNEQRFNGTKELSNHLIQKLLCDSPSEACFSRSCNLCHSNEQTNKFVKYLEANVMDEALTSVVKYKGWINTPCTFVTYEKTLSEFLLVVEDTFEIFIPHSRRVAQQKQFFDCSIQRLNGEIVVINMDFAQQYSCIIQNQAQSFIFNSKQVTLFVAAIHYSENGVHKIQNHVVVSDIMIHDATTVYLCVEKVLEEVRRVKPGVKHIIYFTDGAGGHFKQKFNFINLTYHEQEYGITAELQMYPTSHGKTSCDGLGGNVKRRAREESLRNTDNPIVDADSFYQFMIKAQHKFTNTTFSLIKQEAYETTSGKLELRYQGALTLPNTRSFHSFIPVAPNIIKAKLFAESKDEFVFNLKNIKQEPKSKLSKPKKLKNIRKPLKKKQKPPQKPLTKKQKKARKDK